MNLDNARVRHLLPGRVRLKVPARHRDAAFFDDAARRLAQCAGVTEVRANPLTGSLLVFHTTTLQAINAYASQHGLFFLRALAAATADVSDDTAPPRRRGRAAGAPRIAIEQADRRALALSASLAGLGTLQTMRGELMAPAATLFWYAFDAWRARPSMRLSRGRSPNQNEKPARP